MAHASYPDQASSTSKYSDSALGGKSLSNYSLIHGDAKLFERDVIGNANEANQE